MPHIGDDSPIGRVSAITALAHFAGNTATGGIWRVESATGSAVLKLATPNGEPPAQWNYWHREPLAYRDGYLHRYCADSGITAPQLLTSITRADRAIELWLEDVDGTPGEQWSIERLAEFAGRLGALQARRRDDFATPSWLSHRFLRRYTAFNTLPGDPDWDHPVIARHWPPELRQGLRRLWERRAALFDAAESLPRAICHLDVWPKNLFARGDESVLIDWAFLGHGAVGEDIGNLIPDTCFDGLMDVSRLDEIAQTLTAAYAHGHRKAGGDLTESAVRQAIAVTGAAKYTWLAPKMIAAVTAGHSPGSRNYDPDSDAAEVLERRRPVFELLLDWSRHADTV